MVGGSPNMCQLSGLSLNYHQIRALCLVSTTLLDHLSMHDAAARLPLMTAAAVLPSYAEVQEWVGPRCTMPEFVGC